MELLEIKFNSASQETVANADVVNSKAANHVRLMASLLNSIGIREAFVENVSKEGRTYYSLPAATAQKAFNIFKELLEHQPE